MRRTVVAVLACAGMALAAAPNGVAAIFIVNNNSDSAAACTVVSCTLRAALDVANTTSGPDVIQFNLPLGATAIAPETALPTVSDQVTIAGTSQPGAPGSPVELVGTSVPATTALSLVAGSGGSTIVGLAIHDFAVGISIEAGSAGNVVGGDDSVGNVIWGFATAGIRLAAAGTGNIVAGNTIGLTLGGVPVSSAGDGIDVAGTTGTDIGDSVDPGAPSADRDRGNVVGGAAVGIHLRAASTGNGLAGNYVGVTRAGVSAGVGVGVRVSGGSGNAIGPFNTIAAAASYGVDVQAGSGNRIVANEIRDNGAEGIVIGEGANDNLPAPTLQSATQVGTTTTIEGTIDAGPPDTAFFVEFFTNAACDPSGEGEGRTYIFFVSATTDASGDATFSFPSSAPTVGEVVTATATSAATSSTSRFSNCATVVADGGGGPGIVVTTTADAGAGSLRQAILDANAAAGADTISFNISVPESGPKVIALQTSLPDITGPVTIDGTTQPGYVAAPHAPPVVVLDGSDPGVVGNGLTVAAGGNGSVIRALSITNFNPSPAAAIDVVAADVVVDRSYIGVRPNGTTVGANGVGIRVLGPDAVIGANTGIGLGNLIVASQVAGVELESNDAQVVGNIISAVTGVAGSGNAVGIFNDGATGSVITANGITSSTTGDGVVLGGASAGVDILNNGFSANAGLGIDTRNDGVTENDPPGPIDHENFPTVVSATPNGPNLDVVVQFLARGRLPAESYRLELFRNAACDPSGNGEGEQRLGTPANVTTNVDGFASQTFVVPGTTTGALTATATPLAPGNNRSTSEFSDCLVIGGGGGGTIALDAVQASVPSTGRVPLASIPGSALVARPAGSTEASPIRDIPIRDIPIRDIPIRDIPIADIPIRDIGFADGNVLPLLSAFSLSDIPLLRPGGWPAALAGSPLGTAPPQNVTLRDVLALNLTGLANLTLADLDLSRTALGQVPAAAVVLGGVPLGQLELPGGLDWCTLVGPGVSCSGSSNVLAISIQGAPIADIPIADIPIRDIPIADIPIADIPIRDIPIADIPIRDIPIADIPIADIDNPQSFVNCGVVNCLTGTLYDAFTFGAGPPNSAFVAGATLGDLLLALPEPNDVTLADVLVLLFSSSAAVGWEHIDLETAGLQAAAGGANAIDWNADVQLSGSGTVATVVLPKGSIFDPSVTPTVRVLPAGAPTDLPAPEIGTDQTGQVTLEWPLVGAIGSTLRIAFQTFPPFRVGPQSGTVEATAGGPVATSDPAPISVTETFEPNGEGSPEPVSPDSLYVSYVTQADDLDFYALPTPPVGSTIRVYLSHLPADLDLAVYAPADAQLRPEVTGTEPLDSPPLGDEGVPLTTRQDALPPETLDDLRLVAGRPLVGVSANRGQEDDVVVAISGGGTGNYLIQVTPYNGATSDEPYVLRVEIEPPRLSLSAAALPAQAGTVGTVPALPAGTNTLFLWNRRQIEAQFPGSTAGLLTAMQQTQTTLNTLGFPSAIVGVDGNAAVAGAYAAWNADPGDPLKANAVVRSINALVDSLRGTPNGAGIKYLVLVGGDRAIPFGRLEDYVTISNESGYAQSVGANNELSAALGAGRILSDDPYADTTPVQYLNRQLFVPDLSVGRLVETPTEIVAALSRYRTFNGQLNPTTGTVFGYDFLSDGATEVRTALNARPGMNVPAGATFINQTWTQANVISALLTTAPSVASLNGHADHFRFQPPSVPNALTRPVPFTTANLTATAAATLPNRLVFSMGCHAGLSVGDALVAQVLDWPQGYSREGATYLGNTTFGYGDTNVVAYSEELNRLLAEQVRAGGQIGDALRLAKNEYFSTRGVFGVYDEKAMAAFTLYGMPMWSIGAPTQPASVMTGGIQPLEAGSGASTLAIPTTTVGTDPVTGLPIEKFDASPAFTQVPPSGSSYYLRGDSGVQVSHLRPLQPKLVIELGGTQAHGALVTGLTSSDAGGVNPVYARPIVDQSANEPELSFNDVAYPSKLLTVRTFQVAAGNRQRLVVGTGQFFGDAAAVDANGSGVQRRFTRIEGHVYRSASTDRVAPTFTKIDAFTVAGNAAFAVEVAGGDAERVLAGYRSGTASVWQFVDLAEGAAGRWSGGGPVAANTFEYFVQVVDEAGNVGVSTNKGFYFDGAPLPPDPTPNSPLELDPPDPGPDGWFTGSVVVGVDGPDDIPVQVSVDGGPFVDPGPDNEVTVTGDGVHRVEARDATGRTDVVLIPIDGTAPSVAFATPAANASYEPGSTQLAAYECVDAGSGATQCQGTVAVGSPISTSGTGQKTFEVTVRDRAGNTAVRSVTYNLAYRKILFTSQRSGAGDIYAVGRDGSGLTQLTTSSAVDTEPAWSPDGRKIAFASRRGDGIDLDIFVMDADGSNVVRLTNARGDDTAPAWSPDGSRIAFQSFRDRNVELYVMSSTGANPLRLTNDSKLDTNPTWSPDGAKIAWTRGTLTQTEIYSMNANGTGAATRLTSDGRDPNWGSNGKIVFTRSVVGAFVWEVFTMTSSGGSVTRLTNVSGPDFDPAWSRDSEQIVFASGRHGGINLELYVMSPTGANQQRVTTHAAIDRTPDW